MNTLMTIEPTYSLLEVAAILGVHENTIRNWVNAGLIVPSTKGRQFRFTKGDIENRKAPRTVGRPRKDNHNA